MRLFVVLSGLWATFRERVDADRDRGDVPGWVMVTVMTAALVVALMAVAVPKLRDVFNNAIDSVTG
jgi:hypothetical protein